MKKKALQEMTLEELWELFPIELSAHKSEWKEWADEEIALLKNLLQDYPAVYNHIGSTAIPPIKAKPIVDILVELPDCGTWSVVKDRLESHGYICMANGDHRMSFNKGYTPEGYAERVFHIHFHLPGDNQEVGFRNFLISHPDIAKTYENLKLGLSVRFRNNRDAYTEAKTDFVHHINILAKKESAN